jgi:hypothetical protein
MRKIITMVVAFALIGLSAMGQVYLPLNETDSSWNIGFNWVYNGDVAHTYYQYNCLDSVDTYSFNGVNTRRETYKYDWQGNRNYIRTENWTGTNWIDTTIYILQPYPCGCYTLNTDVFGLAYFNGREEYFNEYNLLWNISNSTWDTIGYPNVPNTIKTINYTSDANNNPLFIEKQQYRYGYWQNCYREYFNYDSNHQLAGFQHQEWDSATSQYVATTINSVRDTNITYYYWYGICNYKLSSCVRQQYNGTAWINQSETFYSINQDTAILLSWNVNNSTFDTTGMNLYSYFDNYVSSTNYEYQGCPTCWDESGYNTFTFGINNEITKRIYDFAFFMTGDYSTWVSTYSNFVPCIALGAGITEHAEKSIISLYPNPTASILTLSIPNNNQKATINLYDMLGEKVQPELITHTSSLIINLENLPQGIYFLEVLMYGEKVVRKVVKMD